MSTFLDGEIDIFIRQRVCARCYGDLVKRPAEDRMWEAICPMCGTAWGGTTISRWYAERLGQTALQEKVEVAYTMPDLFPSPHRDKSAEQIIQELGF